MKFVWNLIRFSKRNSQFVSRNGILSLSKTESIRFTRGIFLSKITISARMLKKRNKSKIEIKTISKNRFLSVSEKWLNFFVMKIIERLFSNLKSTSQFLNMSFFFDKSTSSRNLFSSKKRFFVQFFQKLFFFSKHFRIDSKFDKNKSHEQKKKKRQSHFWKKFVNSNSKFFCQFNQKKAARDSKMKITKNIEINNKKKIYSKSTYQRNAMIILLIVDEFDEKNVFQHLNSKNVFAVATLYQLISDTKKKIFFKQTNLILIFNLIFYIEKNEIIFWIWLDRFRKNSALIAKKRQFVFQRANIVKKKNRRWFSKKIKSSIENFDKKKSKFKRFKNENVV